MTNKAIVAEVAEESFNLICKVSMAEAKTNSKPGLPIPEGFLELYISMKIVLYNLAVK